MSLHGLPEIEEGEEGERKERRGKNYYRLRKGEVKDHGEKVALRPSL